MMLASACRSLSGSVAAILLALTLSACGGGGGSGGGGSSAGAGTPAPTVSISASPTSIAQGGTSQLCWTSTNAAACTASGGWSGGKSSSGAETVTPAGTATYAVTCSGPAGSASASTTVTVTNPIREVTLSGEVTFDRVPFGAATNAGLLLDQASRQPARGVVVQAVSVATQQVVGSAVTDASGRYSMLVPVSVNLFVRVRAELRRALTSSNVASVRDNTAGNAVYVLDGSPADSGSLPGTRNLHASATPTASGLRVAGPFSLLDVVWQATQLVVDAEPAVAFPELQLFWSPSNIPCSAGANGFCDGSSAALTRGQIGTSFYQNIPGQGPSIYVLGAIDSDSDEFDQHVIAHEWGHYYQDSFSRDDSLGGQHTLSERLDLRVAFSEGWGNAFAAMVKGDPVYRDSFGANGASGFSINVESNAANPSGWFNEASVQSIVWDAFDSAADGQDSVSLGFGPIHAAMRGPLRASSAFTSAFSLLNALRAANPSQATGLNTLATAQLIAAGSDDFGSGETNNGGDARNLPVFALMTAGLTRQVCSSLPGNSNTATYNKLGNRRFLRFTIALSGTVSLVARNGPIGSDPDMVVYAAGVERGRAEGTASGTETLTLSLAAGSYVAEIYEFSNVDGSTPRGDTCFDVQLSVS